MITYAIKILPILAAVVYYFIRIEVKLASIQVDLAWIKATLQGMP